MAAHSGPRKRKRGEGKPSDNPPAGVVPISNTRLEIVNKNGVVVDLKALSEKGDEFYSGEFRRRCEGFQSEEAFLGFLGGIEGQWGSRRKRRRIVSACEFGDWLPIGWKLLLGLKRKDGLVSVYCRKYISPNGQQFASCKEASSFLQSYFGLNDVSQQLDPTGDDNPQVYAPENCAGVPHKNINLVPKKSIPHAREMEFNLMGIDNLPEVQVRDLFECYKCNMTFDEKNPYLKHLMTFHQRTTKRYRLGSSIGEGVIIKQDGNYECQICHKVFQERRSYNGHVGVHVRNHVRHSEELPGEATGHKSNASPSQEKLAPRISKMDALIEVAQSSILDTSPAEPNDKADGGCSPNRLEVASVQGHHAVNSDHELINNAQSSILDTSPAEPNGKANGGSFPNRLEGGSVPGHHADNSDHELIKIAQNSILDTTPAELKNDKATGGSSRDRLEVASVPGHHTFNFDNELIEIAQSLMSDTSSAEQNDEANGGSSTERLEVASAPEHHAVNSVHELGSDPNGQESEDWMSKSIVDQGFSQNYVRCIISDEKKVNSFDISHVENNAMAACTSTFEHTKGSEAEKQGNSEQESGLNSQHTPSHDVLTWSSDQIVKENVLQSGNSDSSMTMMQSFDCFPSCTTISNTGKDEFCTAYQKLDDVTDFDELRLEEMECLQFSFMNRQELPPFPEVSMNVENDEVMEEVFNSSSRLESEAVTLNIGGRRQFTTVCVWCRTEFNHEAFESETQSDSVGFMCPSCKAKISGQLNVLDGGLSRNYRL